METGQLLLQYKFKSKKNFISQNISSQIWPGDIKVIVNRFYNVLIEKWSI